MATYKAVPCENNCSYVKLQFINGEILLLSTSSFLFRYSKLLQHLINIVPVKNKRDVKISNNIEIPIWCNCNYILDENNACLFDNKIDLLFMFTLQSNKFLDICKFLDTIHYENTDVLFSAQFIVYVMKNLKEEIQQIKYFMQSDIISILNYINGEDINIQIRTCTPVFYSLFLTEYKEEVIKYNRSDIFESIPKKNDYYRYINKYDNHITQHVKETQEYNDYIKLINNKLVNKKRGKYNLNNIKKLIEQGAYINFQDKYGDSVLHIVSQQKKAYEVIKFLIQNGANVNLQNTYGKTALHFASTIANNIKIIDFLIKNGGNVNLQDNMYYWTALHCASTKKNNVNVIKLLLENDANVNLQDIGGETPIHFMLDVGIKINIIKTLIKKSININLPNISGDTALHFASQKKNNIILIKFLLENGANINLQNNNGDTALHFASNIPNNIKAVKFLVKHGAHINLQNNKGKTALYYASQHKNNNEVIRTESAPTLLVQYLVEHGAIIMV